MRVLLSTGERTANGSDGFFRCFGLQHARRLVLVFVLLSSAVGATMLARPHLRAWHHLRLARRESQRYHTAQAIHHLRICRALWPRDPEVLLLAARAARRAGVYADSERLLHIYREVRGRDDALAFEQLLLTVESSLDEQTTEQCWQYVDEGRFDTALLLEALTRGYLRHYRLDRARVCLDRWQQWQPDNPQLFYLEGLGYLDYLHALSRAADSYRRALELDPDHEEARLGLAVALLEGKSFAQAAQHFEHLLQCQPGNGRVQVGLAECLDGLGETTEAVRLVEEVLARQPEFPPALSLRGQLALHNGQWADAERYLRQALRLNPADHRACRHLVLCLEQSGQDAEARQQRRRLEQMEEDTARFNEIVTQEIARRPRDPSLHYTAGQILLRAGQHAEGIRWLQNALRLDPHYDPARQALAECLRHPK